MGKLIQSHRHSQQGRSRFLVPPFLLLHLVLPLVLRLIRSLNGPGKKKQSSFYGLEGRGIGGVGESPLADSLFSKGKFHRTRRRPQIVTPMWSHEAPPS